MDLHKDKRIRLTDRSSSSGLSSLSDDDQPLQNGATSGKSLASSKSLSAIPARLLRHADSSISDSEMSSPEPQTPPSSQKKPKTSQKGVGMARTVGPKTQQPSSPEVALSVRQPPQIQVKQEELDSAQVSHLAAGVSIDGEDLQMQVSHSYSV